MLRTAYVVKIYSKNDIHLSEFRSIFVNCKDEKSIQSRGSSEHIRKMPVQNYLLFPIPISHVG